MNSNFKNIASTVARQSLKALAITAVVATTMISSQTFAGDSNTSIVIDHTPNQEFTKESNGLLEKMVAEMAAGKDNKLNYRAAVSDNFLKNPKHDHPVTMALERLLMELNSAEAEVYKSNLENMAYHPLATISIVSTISTAQSKHAACMLFFDLAQVKDLATNSAFSHESFLNILKIFIAHEGAHCVDPYVNLPDVSGNNMHQKSAEYVVNIIGEKIGWSEQEKSVISKKLTERWDNHPQSFVLMRETFADAYAMGKTTHYFTQEQWEKNLKGVKQFRIWEAQDHETSEGLSVIESLGYENLKDMDPLQLNAASSLIASKIAISEIFNENGLRQIQKVKIK